MFFRRQWVPVDGVTTDPRSAPKQQFTLQGFQVTDTTTEIEFFFHLFPIALGTLAAYSNKTAAKTAVARHVPVTEAEMLIFMGLFIARSLTPSGSRRALWATGNVDDSRVLFPPPDFSIFMTRNRFESILKSLTVSNPDTVDLADP